MMMTKPLSEEMEGLFKINKQFINTTRILEMLELRIKTTLKAFKEDMFEFLTCLGCSEEYNYAFKNARKGLLQNLGKHFGSLADG